MTLLTCARCGQEFSYSGRAYLCAGCRKPRDTAKLHECAGAPLTTREKQVAALVREGHANKEIAYRLHLTEHTIKGYLHVIFQKVGVGNRTQLAVREQQALN